MRPTWAAAAILASLGTGCSLPPPEEGLYACEPGRSGDCPAGWFCRDDHRCWATAGDGGDLPEAPDEGSAPDDGEVPDLPEGGDDGAGPDEGTEPDDGDGAEGDGGETEDAPPADDGVEGDGDDGVEGDGGCAAGDPCDDGDPCTDDDRCDGSGGCSGSPIDADGDGFGPGDACGGDCDDGERAVNPDADEACNGTDDDCDGWTDDGLWCRVVVPGVTADLFGVHGTGGTDLWVVGAGGVVLRGDGASWSTVPSRTTATLFAVRAAAPDAAVAVGAGGAAIRWDGAAWSPETTGVSADLSAVVGIGPTVALAAGSGGVVVRRGAGGVWATVPSGTTRALRGLWGEAADAIWAVGFHETIRRFDGTAWVDETADGGTVDFWAASGTDPANLWCVGASGRIVHRTGGTNWVGTPSGVTVTLRGVHAGAASAVAVGDGGTILLWDGARWSRMASPVTTALHAVWFSSPDAGWAVGAAGTILRWTAAH